VASLNYRRPLWRIPGGGVKEGEELSAAAVRELREETGLWVDEPRPVLEPILKPSRVNPSDTHTQYVFVGEVTSLQDFVPMTIDGDEEIVAKLFDARDVLEAARKNIRVGDYFIFNVHAKLLERSLSKIFE
jgi:ADP-ribose pyrophosphatase YjhB (NUDIX family)